MIALIDIDGVVADCSHRLHFITKAVDAPLDWRVDWKGFFDAMGGDAPIHSVIKLVRAISQIYDITYLTGRPQSHRDLTLQWLRENKLPLGNIVMRSSSDHRPDYQVKEELYKDYVIPFIGVADIVIEDRDQVVEMWRSLGLTCLQPCKGSY